jgi:hypothetical protein
MKTKHLLLLICLHSASIQTLHLKQPEPRATWDRGHFSVIFVSLWFESDFLRNNSTNLRPLVRESPAKTHHLPLDSHQSGVDGNNQEELICPARRSKSHSAFFASWRFKAVAC